MTKVMRGFLKTSCLLGCLFSSFSMIASADDLQDKFLKDLSSGLEARWNYEEENEGTVTAESKKKQVSQEYDKIKGYAEKEFEDAEFQELVGSYIDAVELQMDAIEDMETLPTLYNAKWQAGYNIRTTIQDIFVGSYGLVMNQEETEVQTETEAETEGESEGLVQEELKVFDKGQIQVWITGMTEDDFYIKFNVRIENGSEQDVLVTTAEEQVIINGEDSVNSPLYAEVTHGKKANTTMTFDKKNTYEEEELKTISNLRFTIVVSSPEAQMVLYKGKMTEVKVDGDGMMSLGEVSVDAAMIQQVQTLLNKAGYDCGTPDGLMGNNTRTAIAAFEKANGMEENTEVTEELLEKLQAIVE